MVTSSNYFVASQGRFIAMSQGTTKKFFDAWEHGESSLYMQGRLWVLNFVSGSLLPDPCHWYGVSWSCYWVCSETQQLVRLSNHWSEGAHSGVTNCCWIRRCYWTITRRKSSRTVVKVTTTEEDPEYGNSTFEETIEGGIIRLKDLKALN